MLADDRKVDLESARSVLVYQDATIATRYYYASTRPAIARDDTGYQLALVHYDAPMDGWAGMLSFVVDLRPDDAAMTSMRSELAARHPGDEVQLVPIPWTAGTVAVAVVGGEPVLGTPSLLGENAAAVSVPLTTDQYLMLRERGSKSATAASVVYGLSFDAMRPEYGATIHFDAERFRTWLQKKVSAGFLFFSVEKVETFEDLTSSGVIRIESESMTGEAPPAGFQLAFLRSMQSILMPMPRFASVAESDSGNWLIGFDSSIVSDTQKIARRLDTDMRMAGAVARKVFIQGELAGLEQALAQRPDIALSTQVSFMQTLTVRCHDAFDGQPLEVANVELQPRSLGAAFHSFKEPGEQWPLQLAYVPGQQADYACQCSFIFAARGPSANTAAATGTIGVRPGQAFLDIVPAAYYTYGRYAVTVADDFPWPLVASVRVSLAGSPALAFQPAQAVLTAAAPSQGMIAFAPTVEPLDEVSCTVTIVPRTSAAGPITLAGLPAGASIYINPLRRRTVTFSVPADFDWDDGTRVTVVVDAIGGRQQLWSGGSLQLTPAAPRAAFVYWYAGEKAIRYRARIRKNGQDFPIQPTETSQTNVVLMAFAPAT